MEILKFKADHEIPEGYLEQLNNKFDLWMDRDDCDYPLKYHKLFLAVSDDIVQGFQSINDSCECLVIEVLPQFRGQGISFKLIEESESTTPYELSNDNPDFWKRVAKEWE